MMLVSLSYQLKAFRGNYILLKAFLFLRNRSLRPALKGLLSANCPENYWLILLLLNPLHYVHVSAEV
jgi:hypothetical protein